MKNHPNRARGPYVADVGGASSMFAPVQLPSVRECRAHAESYGCTADWCEISDAKGRLVASHRRDKSGDGIRWFRAQI